MHHWRMSQNQHDLAGRTIVVTRTEGQAEQTAEAIRHRGGVPILFPCLELERLDRNIRKAVPLLQEKATSVLFTSGNGVDCVAETLGSAFTLLLKPHKIIAVGERTAAALASHGIDDAIAPETPSQAGLIELFERTGIPERLLFFRAEEGSNAVAEALSAAGCRVKTIYAYRMRMPEGDVEEISAMLKQHKIDGVLLGSAKTTINYIQRIGDPKTAAIPAIAVISPEVAATAEKAGLSVQAVAKSASFDAMLDALSGYFDQQGA